MKISDEITILIRESTPMSVGITKTAHLYTDLGFDSLAFVQLLLSIEKRYMISFSLEQMEECLRLDKLIALVEKKVKESDNDSKSFDKSKKTKQNRNN